jgi:hypothetical protein
VTKTETELEPVAELLERLAEDVGGVHIATGIRLPPPLLDLLGIAHAASTRSVRSGATPCPNRHHAEMRPVCSEAGKSGLTVSSWRRSSTLPRCVRARFE